MIRTSTLVFTVIVAASNAFGQTPNIGSLYDQLLQSSDTNRLLRMMPPPGIT